ncbi:MAG: flap endonuclease-1 [DPANN group archaeon]|nr:flap endonuclease-1 [DPANN group archaeon]
MGIKIGKIIPKKEITLQELKGKTVAIDAFNIIYQFLTTIKDWETGEPFKNSKGNVTSHISGLFYRSINLMNEGINLVYVFDGKKPDFKSKTTEMRKETKIAAKEKLNIALKENDKEGIKRYAQATSYITSEMIKDAKELLDAMGIPYVQAPSEGEAQASVMTRNGTVYATVSQDIDTMLFGCPRLIRNLSTTQKKKVPGRNIWIKTSPEIITLADVLNELELTQDQIIVLGILVGTDFNPGGILGLGPKKALKLVKEKKTLEATINSVEWNTEVNAKDIFDFFKSPPVTDDYSLEQRKPDIDKIHKLLIGKHEFAIERVDNSLKKLENIKKKKQQSSLFQWKQK